MKKVLPVLLLSLVITLPGCYYSGSVPCTFSGPPNVRYFVRYPDATTATGTVGPTGSFTVRSGGVSCSSLMLFFGNDFGFALTASPSSVYLPSPPVTGTITGQGFDTTYGMPMVEYFDSNGYFCGAVYATAVSSDGTSLQANMPNLTYVYSGTYQVKVINKTYTGYYLDIVGSATMTGWGRDRTDSDGDGWYDDEDCDPYDPSLNYDCTHTCGGYDNIPRYFCNDEPF